MIRPAEEKDRAALAEIWSVCFGDSAAYIGAFFDRWLARDRCLVCEQDGAPVAMLHLLPQKVRLRGEEYTSQYLYAAATLPAWRGRGVMRGMLAAAVQSGDEAGCAFTTLMPAQPGLYDYYAAAGYCPLYAVRELTAQRKALVERVGDISPAQEVPVTLDKAAVLRDVCFTDGILWQNEDFFRVLQEWLSAGGELIGFPNGYALALRQGDTLFVRELCGRGKDRLAMLCALLTRYSCTQFRFFLPPGSRLMPGAKLLRYGMFYPHRTAPAHIVRALEQNKLYMNMMLD